MRPCFPTGNFLKTIKRCLKEIRGEATYLDISGDIMKSNLRGNLITPHFPTCHHPFISGLIKNCSVIKGVIIKAGYKNNLC